MMVLRRAVALGAAYLSWLAMAPAASATPVHRPLVLSARAHPERPGAGGQVAVSGTVRHAATCQLALMSRQSFPVVYSHNPTACRRGRFSAQVRIGANTSRVKRTVAFALVARNGPCRDKSARPAGIGENLEGRRGRLPQRHRPGVTISRPAPLKPLQKGGLFWLSAGDNLARATWLCVVPETDANANANKRWGPRADLTTGRWLLPEPGCRPGAVQGGPSQSELDAGVGGRRPGGGGTGRPEPSTRSARLAERIARQRFTVLAAG